MILIAEPIPHPKRPPLSPSRRSSFFAADKRALLHIILMQFVAEGVAYAVGPVRPPHSALNVNCHLLGW